MQDFKTTSDGDLDLSSGGFELVEGLDAIEQQVYHRTYLNRGDWFLGLNQGIPYFTRILIASPNEADAKSIFIDEYSKIPGVLPIGNNVDVSTEGSSMSVKAQLETIDGSLELDISGGV